MRPPKPFLDHSPLAPDLASSSSSSSSSSFPRVSTKHALSPGSLPDPSSGLLALLVTVAGSSSSADARPLDDSDPDSPPEFLCPRLHSWSPSEHITSHSATPSWVFEPCDASEAAAYVDLSLKRRKRRTRRAVNIADKYVQGPDGRWRKADSWELYGSSSCPASGCMDDPAETDRPVQDDQVTASASAVSATASSSSSSAPNLPAGWDKNRDEDNLTGMILALSLSLAFSLIIFMIIVVRWRHKRRARHRRDAEKTPSIRSEASMEESEEVKRARTQQRLWARASAKWVAKVRQSARRRRKRKGNSAAMDADNRALREAQASSSAVSLSRTQSAPATDLRRSAASSTRTAPSRSPSPTPPDQHREDHFVHPLQHPPAYPHGSSHALEPAYSHWHSHPLDSRHAPDIPPPATPPPCPADRAPPPPLSPLPYEPPVHSAHVAVDDKTVLARMLHFASAPPPLSPDDPVACGPSSPAGLVGGSSEMQPSVPVLDDDPFEDGLPPDIESLDSDANIVRPDRPRPRAHDAFPAPPPLPLLPHASGRSMKGLDPPPPAQSERVRLDGLDELDVDGMQEEAEIPSYAEDVARHPPLVLPPPPAKVPMAGPMFYEYPDEFERDVVTVEPVTEPSAPPFEYEYTPPRTSSDNAAAAAAPSAPPLDFDDDVPVGLEGLIPSAPPLADEDEVEARKHGEGSAPPHSSSSSAGPRSRSCSRSSLGSHMRSSVHGGGTLSASHSPSVHPRGSPSASADARDSQAHCEDLDAVNPDPAPPRYLP